jgi:16S rRNA (cytidine1402-2'-O)-methyltransferase
MHNEVSRAEELMEALKAGGRIAVVSDAGTPGISDPGGQIAATAIAGGIPVFPVPGANAAVSGLIASGLPTERFIFHGFLPAKEGARRTALEALPRDGSTQVFYEAPHRIVDTLGNIEAIFGTTQYVVIGRELTKLHEEFLRGTAGELRVLLVARASVRGEIVLMMAPVASAEEDKAAATSISAEIAALMKREGLEEMDALKRVAKDRGMGKSEAYRELQREQKRLR